MIIDVLLSLAIAFHSVPAIKYRFYKVNVKMTTPQADPSEGDDPDQGVTLSAAQLPKIIKFESLARCGEEIWIESEGQIYRLRKTRQGKLILTK